MTTPDLETPQPLYRDPSRTVAERVEDLLGRMTLPEKLAQLGSHWIFELADGDGLVQEQLVALLKDGLGQVTRIAGASSMPPREAAQTANAIQAHLAEHTRLGIPAIVHEEICSGLMARDAVIFPQAIGLASTWEPELVQEIADAIRTQMRASGSHQGLGPVLDVARDPRWGRTEETFGEDPHLVAEMGCAFVAGLQGESLADGVVATGKHFIGYAASEGGRNWGPPVVAPRLLRDVHVHPFEAAIRGCGLRSIMHAYNEVDGVPCGADRELLTTLLRDELGFEGAVVSDYFAVRQIAEYHRFVADGVAAAAAALRAGIDVELPSTDCYGEPLEAALESGAVSGDDIDEAVRRVLTLKFELGLFERPFADLDEATASAGTPAQHALARRAAARSIVLLRNEGVLPLAAGATVAVIGPSADEARNFFGDYAYPAHIESLREVIKSGGGNSPSGLPLLDSFALEDTTTDAPSVVAALRARHGDRIRFARGCDIGGDDRSGFDEAVALARESDVAVLVVGDKSGLTDECTTGESRDRSSLDLPGVQEELVRAVADTGTPVVLVLVAGRPVGSEDAHTSAQAVIQAWLPGEHGGEAIADVLTGEATPGGKLPVSFPRNVGQLPVFYGHKISGGRSHWKGDYVDGPTSPLYPFGFGLSYTTFALEDVELVAGTGANAFAVGVTVRNTGERAGDEVVQLYVRDPEASVTRPVLELKAFARVSLAAGEAQRVRFEIPLGHLGFTGRDLRYVVEPGELTVFVGTSVAELHEAGSVTLAPATQPEKAFRGRTTVTPLPHSTTESDG